MLKCTIFCQCLGLEVGSECKDVRFVAGVLGSKRGPNAKMYDFCRCLGLKAWSECKGVRFVAGVLGSKRGPNAKMYDLLPVS